MRDMATFDTALFDAVFFAALARCRWLIKKMPPQADISGGRSRGGGHDFVGFHRYGWGDDLRYVDWPFYARSGQMFVREFAGDSAGRLLLVVDVSASMHVGEPAKNVAAIRTAAAAAILFLQQGGQVQIALLSDQFIMSPCFHRHTQISALLAFFSQSHGGGRVEWRALRSLAPGRSTCMVLVSDLWAAQGARQYLSPWAQQGSLCLLHLLSPQELEPLPGMVSLCDVESGERMTCHIDQQSIFSYQKRLRQFCQEWQKFCTAQHIAYRQGHSAMPMWQMLSLTA